MKQFISFNDGILKTICHVYKHEDGSILHLLPVLHIGEKKYYEELLEYIGEKKCVYENIDLKVEDAEYVDNKSIQSFDEWLAYNEQIAEQVDKELGPEVKKFHRKKIFRRMVRRLRNFIEKNLDVVDERVTKFFRQLERTNFALHNLAIAQVLLAEFLDLSHQYSTIDYLNDIPKRTNWIHGDVAVEIPNRPFEEIKKDFKRPNPLFVEFTRNQALTLYSILYQIQYSVHKDHNGRRREFVNLLLETEPDVIPDYLLEGRNNIVIGISNEALDEHNEVIIFYGAAHMPGIKAAAEKAGFELVSTIEFEVFECEEEETSEKKADSSTFITHGEEDDYLKTMCHVYNREDGKTIHLLPKFHYAEKRYYEELLNYIDDVNGSCIYQKPFLSKSVKSFEDCFEIGEMISEKFQNSYSKVQLKKFYKDFYNKELRNLKKLPRKYFRKVDRRIPAIYRHIEQGGFKLGLLNEIHAFMAEFLNLSFEMSELDYVDDLPSRTNWVPNELQMKSFPEDYDISTIMNSENEQQLHLLRYSALVLFYNAYVIGFYNDIEDMEDRLYEVGESILTELVDDEEYMSPIRTNPLSDEIDKQLEIKDKVVIFYDVWYMQEIEQELLELGFDHQSEKEFNLFCMHSDTEDDEEDDEEE